MKRNLFLCASALVPFSVLTAVAACKKSGEKGEKKEEAVAVSSPSPKATEPAGGDPDVSTPLVGALNLSLAEEALGTLPAIEATQGFLLDGADLTQNNALSSLFKFECYMDNNFICPTSITEAIRDLPETNNDRFKYKFTSGTLLGIIYHAEMYMKGQYDSLRNRSPASSETCTDETYSACRVIFDEAEAAGCMEENAGANCESVRSRWDEASCAACESRFGTGGASEQDSSSALEEITGKSVRFVATTARDAGETFDAMEAGQYTIPMPGMYDFKTRETWTEKGVTSSNSSVLSASTEGKRFASVTVRKHVPYFPPGSDTATSDQNNIFQQYMTTEDGVHTRIFASNYTGLWTYFDQDQFHGQRAVLVANFLEGKFILKTHNLVVIGKGGRDSTTGAYKPGYYYAKVVESGPGAFQGCVDNTTQLEVADTHCAAEKPLVAGEGDFDVAAYLGLNAQESDDLVGYVNLLKTNSVLPAEQMPTAPIEDYKKIPDDILAESTSPQL